MGSLMGLVDNQFGKNGTLQCIIPLLQRLLLEAMLYGIKTLVCMGRTKIRTR
jgi:hypothetical protein